MNTIDQQIDQACDELKGLMRQWDVLIESRSANMQQIGFLQLRIDGICRELDKLRAARKVA